MHMMRKGPGICRGPLQGSRMSARNKDRPKGSLWISQLSYVKTVVNRFIRRTLEIPKDPYQRGRLSPVPENEEIKVEDRFSYRQKIGSIMFHDSSFMT